MILLLMTLLSASCTYRELKVVESVMETDPLLADSLLNGIRVSDSGRSRALYALLRTQIDYKLYRPAQNDSLIRIATDYYGKYRKGYHAAMSWYSLGCLAAELGRDSTASEAYLISLKLFPDTLVRYYALAEQNLSCIYVEHKMDVEALPMIESCLTNSARLKDSMAIAFCEFNIARSLLRNNEYDSARTAFLKLKNSKWLSPNTKDAPYLELSKIALYIDDDYDQALEYADSFLIRNNHYNPSGLAYSIKADAYKSLNVLDSALRYYRCAISDTDDPYVKCNVYRGLAEVYSQVGMTDSAAYCSRRVSEWADSIVSTSGSDIILRKLLEHSESDNFKLSKFHKTGLSVSILLACAAIVTVLIRFKKTVRKNNIGIRDFEADIEAFKNSALYKSIVIAINNQTVAVSQLNSVVNQFQDSLFELRKYIQSSSQELSSREIDFCVFTLLGFRQVDFHKVFPISYSGSRNLKSRIKNKMPKRIFDEIFEN